MTPEQINAIALGATCWTIIALGTAAFVYFIKIKPMNERNRRR